MHYNDVVEKIGMTIDGAGVIVIVVGAVIAFGVAFVRLAHRETDIAGFVNVSARLSC